MDAKDLRLECVHLAVKLNPYFGPVAPLGSLGAPTPTPYPTAERILADATKIWEFVISTTPRSKAK